MVDRKVADSLVDETVKVKLTDRGEEILKRYDEEWNRVFQSLNHPKVTRQADAEGWLEFKAFDFLIIFDQHLYEDGPELFTDSKFVNTT